MFPGTFEVVSVFCYSLISLKHEAFMFGASKTKHDDRGSELLITTAPIPDPSEKLMVLDG